MRLREVFTYELAYRVRSVSTWAYALFLFLVIGWGLVATADGSDMVKANAPQDIAQSIVLFGGMFGLLVSAALFGDAATRDVAAGMDQLLYTTRLRTAELLLGRFLAALTVNALVVIALPLGHVVATLTPLVEAGALGPFRLAAYVQPLLFFTIPNVVLAGSIMFSIGLVARQMIPVYLGAIGVFIGYVSAANYWHRIDNPLVSALGDPFGINALLMMNRFLSPAEQNTQLVGFPALLVWNRVLWLAVAALVLVVLHRAFRFAHAGSQGGRWRTGRRATVDVPLARHSHVAVRRVAGTFGLRTRLLQVLAVARRSFGDVMAGIAFRVVLLGCAGLVLLMGWNVTTTVFDTSTWPVTQLVAGTVLSQRIAIFPWLIIVLYAGELVWKEREVGAAEIADAVPVPDGLVLLGRFLALVAMIAAVLTAYVAGGVVMQTLQGYHNYELWLYARIVFGMSFIDYVLLAAIVMTVHVLVNHKYVGHIIALSAAVFMKVAPMTGVLPRLSAYNSDPGWQYSDMNGFGPFVGPYLWFKAYWAAWALLLGVVAALFWVRGRESGLRHRFALARARFIGPLARSAGIAILLIGALGGFIFYNTAILNEFVSRDRAGWQQAEYEKRYARYEKIPQPTITDAKLQVEIYPDEPAVDLSGTYRLVNRTAGPIDSVHIYVDPDVEARFLSFEPTARHVQTDEAVGYSIYVLDRALEPGDSVQLAFEVGVRQRGFRNTGAQTAVVRNGTYFDRGWLPFIGYQPAAQLADNDARERFGLTPRSLPPPNDPEARRYRNQTRNEELARIVTVVGTAADQTAITAGTLRRSWEEGGRRYFEYESEGRISLGPFFSGRYAVAEDRWTDPSGSGQVVPLQIFHHPEHGGNLGSIMHGMKASLDYYSKTYGPYPFEQLRVVEVPPYSIFGRAHAGTIAFSEAIFFSRRMDDELDQAFYGTAHEVGHQWQESGALVRGIGYLGESFANYSAVMVMEKTFGTNAARQAYDVHMGRYLVGRAEQSNEVPVLDVAYQTFIMYRKGAIALYTLRDFLGADAVNGALRRFLEKNRNAGPPYATALEQYAELRAVTPDSLEYLLTDLFETVTLWDVRTERASVEPTGTGAYEVTLDVVAKKTRADIVGVEKEVPMNDLVEIGLFAAPREGDGRGTQLYLTRHWIKSGKQTIRVTVPKEPARAGIDPYHKLIDRDREDNVVAVTAAGSR